jgi:hypothetical protein
LVPAAQAAAQVVAMVALEAHLQLHLDRNQLQQYLLLGAGVRYCQSARAPALVVKAAVVY